jgi:cation transport ATPase
MALVTESRVGKSSPHEKPSKRSHRLRDFAVYVAISVCIVVLIGLLAVHQAKTGQKPGALLKWIGFAVMTLLIFWWAIRAYRPYWGNARFWRLLAVFALLHVVLGISILTRLIVGSLFPFVLAAALEYYLLLEYLEHLLLPRE